MKGKTVLVMLFAIFISCSFISAAYSDCEIYGSCKPVSTIVEVNQTQMTVPIIEIQESWLSAFVHSIIDVIFTEMNQNVSSINTTANIQNLLNGTTMNFARIGIATAKPDYLLEIANVNKALNVSGVLYVNGSSGNVGIGTTSPMYPLTIAKNTSETNESVSIWASGNISAVGFIDRTSIYDSKKGSVWDFIKDSSEYLNPDGTINHKSFYGYTDFGMVPDYQNPIIIEKEVCSDVFNEDTNLIENKCSMQSETIYNLKHEGGVDLGQEIAVLREALYELKIAYCISNPFSEICK